MQESARDLELHALQRTKNWCLDGVCYVRGMEFAGCVEIDFAVFSGSGLDIDT